MTGVITRVPARPLTGFRHGTLASGLTLTALAAVLVIAAASAGVPGDSAAWGGVALAALCAGLLCITAALSGRDGLGLAQWKIGPWSLAWCAAASGLATITWRGPQAGLAAEIAPGSVQRALWLVAAGMTAYAAGYCAGPSRALRAAGIRAMTRLSARRTAAVRSAAVPWALYVTGTAGRLALLATTGHFGYVGDAASAVSAASGYRQILGLAALLCPLAIATAAVRAWGQGAPGARVQVAVLAVIEVAAGAAAGGKQSFIVAILAILIPWTAARRRMPPAAIFAAALVFLAVVIPFNHAYRQNAGHGGTGSLSAGQAVSSAPAILRGVVSADSGPGVIGQSVAYLGLRMREIDSPAIVLQRTPQQVPFAGAALLAEGPAADLIPRALWPGKPVLATGYQFSREYYGTPSNLYTSSAVTPAADLYGHAGWLAVLAGMLLLGCAVRVLDDVLDPRRDPHAMLLVLLLFPGLVRAEGDWATMLAGFPATILLWILAVRFSFARR